MKLHPVRLLNKFTKGKKTIKVKKNNVKIKRLKSKKKYFVKVRAFLPLEGIL